MQENSSLERVSAILCAELPLNLLLSRQQALNIRLAAAKSNKTQSDVGNATLFVGPRVKFVPIRIRMHTQSYSLILLDQPVSEQSQNPLCVMPDVNAWVDNGFSYSSKNAISQISSDSFVKWFPELFLKSTFE
jgi:hypothetical protein